MEFKLFFQKIEPKVHQEKTDKIDNGRANPQVNDGAVGV
jgi:hypothetical protein